MIYNLMEHGDDLEKKYYPNLISVNFPSYEIWWQNNVVPITNRPKNIHIKSDTELQSMGKGYIDVYLSQAHYTILKHIIRSYELQNQLSLDDDQFIEFVNRLASGINLGIEFLELNINYNLYQNKLNSCIFYDYKFSKDVASKGLNNNKILNLEFIKLLKKYRNSLNHGTMHPRFNGKYPKIDKFELYQDWRTVTSDYSKIKVFDFEDPISISQDLFKSATTFLENNWKNLI